MMKTYDALAFSFPHLEGISQQTMDEHVGLYQGYVKNFNAMSGAIIDLAKEAEKNAHAIAELRRRRSFEFGGMRLHEYYFKQLEGGSRAPSADSAFSQALSEHFGAQGLEEMKKWMRMTAMMRGPGWAILYWDPIGRTFHIGFSEEQHLGHFVALPIILALDVWEHAFILDYGAQGKGKYVDAFFDNLDWDAAEKRFSDAA